MANESQQDGGKPVEAKPQPKPSTGELDYDVIIRKDAQGAPERR